MNIILIAIAVVSLALAAAGIVAVVSHFSGAFGIGAMKHLYRVIRIWGNHKFGLLLKISSIVGSH